MFQHHYQRHIIHYWVNSDYRFNSKYVSHSCFLLSDLQWPTLEHHWHFTRLKLFYIIMHRASVFKLPQYFPAPLIPPATTIFCTLRFLFTRCNNYKYSFAIEQYLIGTINYPFVQIFKTVFRLTLICNIINGANLNISVLYCIFNIIITRVNSRGV